MNRAESFCLLCLAFYPQKPRSGVVSGSMGDHMQRSINLICPIWLLAVHCLLRRHCFMILMTYEIILVYFYYPGSLARFRHTLTPDRASCRSNLLRHRRKLPSYTNHHNCDISYMVEILTYTTNAVNNCILVVQNTIGEPFQAVLYQSLQLIIMYTSYMLYV